MTKIQTGVRINFIIFTSLIFLSVTQSTPLLAHENMPPPLHSYTGLSSADSAKSFLGGILTADTTLDQASGPWQITRDLIVPAEIMLQIEADTKVYFEAGVKLTVHAGGRLVAAGQENARIQLTNVPGRHERWGGLIFEDSQTDNQLCYVDQFAGDGRQQMILVKRAQLLIDNMTWTPSDKTILEVDHPSVIVRNSIFPNVQGVETIHGQSLHGEEYFILEGNTFGQPTGYNDVIDFSDCKRPGPIFQAYNNIFLGGGDDGLDLDGCDAHIEGNRFMHFHKGHTASSTSNAIATGFRFERTSDIVVVRNIFYDNDHAVLLKEDCFLHAENNVFVKCNQAVINFSEWPDRDVTPGKGAYFDGNIFWNNQQLFENQYSQPGNPDPQITVNRCIIPQAAHSLGTGNLDADPLFVDPESDFHLLPGSPARGCGPNELDMGAYVPAGASISGEPPEISQTDTAHLVIGGPGITHYRFTLNTPEASWSEIFSLELNPSIELTDLQDGVVYTVYVQGQNSAGVWQKNPEYAVSKSWRVDLKNTAVGGLRGYSRSEHFILSHNFPNPFNAWTLISFILPKNSPVVLTIYNQQGQALEMLLNRQLGGGEYQIRWNATNRSSGVYFYRLQSNDFCETKKMILLR